MGNGKEICLLLYRTKGLSLRRFVLMKVRRSVASLSAMSDRKFQCLSILRATAATTCRP